MTTAFAHAANGDLVSSFRAQPLGMVLAVGSSLGFWLAFHSAAFGSAIGPLVANRVGRRTLWISLTMLFVAWGYKVLNWPGAS